MLELQYTVKCQGQVDPFPYKTTHAFGIARIKGSQLSMVVPVKVL